MGTCVLLLAGMVVIALGVLSPWGVGRFTWPVATALVAWSGVSFVFVTAHLWAEAATLGHLLGTDPAHSARLVAPITIAVAAAAIWGFRSQTGMVRFVYRLLDPQGLRIAVALPLFILGVAAVRAIGRRRIRRG